MRRIGPLCLFAAVLLAPHPARATVIEVPLPGLTGVYMQDGLPEFASKSTTFVLPALPSVVHGVSLRVHGTNSFGLFSCDTQYGMQPFWIPTHTGASMTPDAGEWFVDRSVDSDAPGDFTWTTAFTGYGGATWSFLLDGSGDITMGSSCDSAIPSATSRTPARTSRSMR